MKERCSVTVYQNNARGARCRNSATVMRKGVAYCRFHDPEAVKQRRTNKQLAEWENEFHQRERIVAHHLKAKDTAERKTQTTDGEEFIRAYREAFEDSMFG